MNLLQQILTARILKYKIFVLNKNVYAHKFAENILLLIYE